MMKIGCLILVCILVLWIIGSLYKLGISIFSVLLQILKIFIFTTIIYCLLLG